MKSILFFFVNQIFNIYSVKYFVYIIYYSIFRYLKLYDIIYKRKIPHTYKSISYSRLVWRTIEFVVFLYIFMLFNSHTNHEPIEHHLIEIMNEPIVYSQPWTLDQFVGQYRCIYIYV